MEEQKYIDLVHNQRYDEFLEVFLWQWQCDAEPWKDQDSNNWTWQNYSDEHCLIIEQAFNLKKETIDLQNYRLDLGKMLQVNRSDKGRVRRIRRQTKSRFMMEMSEPRVIPREQKTMSEAFGTIQHFLNYIMKRTPEAFGLYQRLKELSLDCQDSGFHDLILEVTICILRGAEAREKIIKSRTGTQTTNFISEANQIADFIYKNSTTLKNFLNATLKIYTMETFVCYWLNELLRSEDWQEINVLTPYLVCLVYTFQLSEYTIKKPKRSFKDLLGLVSKPKLCLYRGTVLTKAHLDLYNPNKVEYFSWNAVTSTSRNKNVAFDFVKLSLAKTQEPKIGVVFLIETNFSSSEDREGVIDISQESQYPDEQEVILVPGTVFKLLKTRKIENDIYQINLKVTRKFNKKEEATLLGTLHDEAVQSNTAVIEGFPSKQSFKLLKLLKGNKTIQKLEIKNSVIDEEIIEKIENMRATTKVKKQDINLVNNTIVVNNVALLIDYFSPDNLTLSHGNIFFFH